jgi:Mg-chelatase subunit ChlD
MSISSSHQPNFDQLYVARLYLLDTSLSMGFDGKLAALQQVLRGLLRQGSFYAQDMVAAYAFNHAPHPLLRWTRIREAAAGWQRAIDALRPEGSTAMASALYAGIGAMTAAKGMKKTIVLMTDGQSTEPNDLVLARIPAAQRYRIRINAIGFGACADEALLRELAHATDGHYHHANTLEQLERAFRAA